MLIMTRISKLCVMSGALAVLFAANAASAGTLTRVNTSPVHIQVQKPKANGPVGQGGSLNYDLQKMQNGGHQTIETQKFTTKSWGGSSPP
jgi:hypothetical protein